MKRDTKLKIYNVLYWTGRIIGLPFDLILLLIGLWYSYIYEPLDDALLRWVETNNEEK